MLLILLVIAMIVGGHIWNNNQGDYDVGGKVLASCGYILLGVVIIFLIGRSIDEKVAYNNYDEFVNRIETCEYSQAIRTEVYNHNKEVRNCTSLKHNAFIGVFIAKAITELPLIEYREVSQENKITIIKGE